MKKIAKGKFGYTLSHRKWQILKMSLYIALALAVFLLGLIVTKTTKNVLSIVAIIFCSIIKNPFLVFILLNFNV